MTGKQRLKALIRQQEKAQGASLLAASVTAALVAASAVMLLGLSGWFITASALAGLAGPVVAKAFNYLIPSSLIRLLAIVRTASRYGERMTGHRAALQALAALRPQLFSALTRAPSDRFLALSSGEASSRLMQDVEAVQNHFVRRSAPLGALSGLGAGLAMGLVAGWPVALVLLVTSLLGLGLSSLIAKKLAHPAGHRLQAASGELKAEFAALSAAAPELQAYGVRDWAIAQVNAKAKPLDHANQTLVRAGSLMASTQTLFLAIALIGVILTGPVQTPPLMALALLAAVTTSEGAVALLNALRQAGSVQSAVERLGELIPPTEQEAKASSCPRSSPNADLQIMACGLKLSPPNRLAITGRSGSGKTSLIERLMHLRSPVEGEVEMGGQDITSLSSDQLRPLFSYAPQHPMLLAATVRANLKLAQPEATDEALWQALETADLADLIRQCPKGLDTYLGENGARLSGGERRRLGLARAYLRPSPWLVLDEPTEGLDPITEARVLSRLEQHLYRSGQGLVVISHRPGPMAMCNHQIEVLNLSQSGQVNLAEISVKKAA